MRLGKIMIFVADLDEAKRFYCNILGFPLKSETANRLDFDHYGCDFIAFKCDKNTVVEDYADAARSVFVFRVDGLDKCMKEFREAGVAFIHDVPGENEFSRYAAFSDPFGNVHEIYEPKVGVKPHDGD